MVTQLLQMKPTGYANETLPVAQFVSVHPQTQAESSSPPVALFISSSNKSLCKQPQGSVLPFAPREQSRRCQSLKQTERHTLPTQLLIF